MTDQLVANKPLFIYYYSGNAPNPHFIFLLHANISIVIKFAHRLDGWNAYTKEVNQWKERLSFL